MNVFFMIALMLLPVAARAEEVLVAVAANFTSPMEKIAIEFKRDTGHTVSASYGSTGKFYTQIVNGAPFEVLLAADEEHPDKLLSAGFAQSKTDFIYAIGKLVLWSPKSNFVDSQGEVLSAKNFKHLSIASPKLAPYGAAAEEALQNLGLWKKLEEKLIYGDSISQAHQFVVSGNAEIGMLSLSQVKSAKGSLWIVPQNLYRPLRQKAVLLKAGQEKKAAEAFLEFLKSEKARGIIQDFGYERN
ncbi:molybdate ABC transporter substrate-binding protein [Bdellovibrio sp.]|uniref:molybdate ABC transporter substrate-binding protein n=1 Tax=Bdellovibrio TaxID=958 RepID=UPI00322157B2